MQETKRKNNSIFLSVSEIGYENSRDPKSLSPLSGAIALHIRRQSSLAFSMIFFLSKSLA